jgi:hypothetical protein
MGGRGGFGRFDFLRVYGADDGGMMGELLGDIERSSLAYSWGCAGAL